MVEAPGIEPGSCECRGSDGARLERGRWRQRLARGRKPEQGRVPATERRRAVASLSSSTTHPSGPVAGYLFGLSSNGCGWVEARSAGRRGVLAVHLTGGGRGAPWPGVGRSGVAAGRPACQRATRVLRLSVYHWLEWALGWPIPAAPLASQASQTPLGGRWSDRVLRGPSRVVAQFGRHRLPKSWMDTRASRLA